MNSGAHADLPAHLFIFATKLGVFFAQQRTNLAIHLSQIKLVPVIVDDYPGEGNTGFGVSGAYLCRGLLLS